MKFRLLKSYDYINWLEAYLKDGNQKISLNTSTSFDDGVSEEDKEKIKCIADFFEEINEIAVQRLGYKKAHPAHRSYYIKYNEKDYEIYLYYIYMNKSDTYHCKLLKSEKVPFEASAINFEDLMFYANLESDCQKQKKLYDLESEIEQLIKVDEIRPIAILEIAKKYMKEN